MREEERLVEAALTATDEEVRGVSALLEAANSAAPHFWEIGEQVLVPVEDAEIRVIHCAPRTPRSAAQRPIVLVPGFGVIPEGFQDFYTAVHGKAELYYVETREKGSSRLCSGRPDMSVARSARDLRLVMAALGLAGRRDFVLVAVCWGASIALEGMIGGFLDAPTVLLADPMHALWFPKWVLRWISPLLPVPIVRALRPFVFRAMLGDMREPAQKERARAFVYGADVGKWKRSAEAARDFELFGRLSAIGREVFVLNGTKDKIHDPRNYPRMARELPKGRFLYMSAGEHEREKLVGTAALELARVSAAQGLPPSLAWFEKRIHPSPRKAPGSSVSR
jgi:pimeloyl-ACP methyl ester carboxylesterase